MLDLTRIEPLFLKENQLVGLGLPDGYLFFRILLREGFVYLYAELSARTADLYTVEAQYGIAARNITNAFRIDTYTEHLYQAFRGICPSALRTYLGVPYSTPQFQLDEAARLTKSAFGYLSGFESPLDSPSPKSEVWIPYKLDVGWADYNPLNDSVKPLIKFIVNRYKVGLIRDVDLIMNILRGAQPCRLATVGGLATFSYPCREYYGIDPVQLTNDRATVEQKVTK